MSRLRHKRPVEPSGWASPDQPASSTALPDVVQVAERIVYAERWRVYEEQAAARSRGTRSVRWTGLFPNSPVNIVVAVGGSVVGHDFIQLNRLGERRLRAPKRSAST